MTNRSRLKCHVNEAWRRTICNEYHGRQINNEAALQAHFVKHLEAVFSEQEVERRIFIEPPFKLQGRDELPRNRIPDIVVCSAQRIIGLIELKYAPRGTPRFDLDLQKLCWIFESRGTDIALKAERYCGPTNLRPFSFSTDVLLVYAAVYRGTKTRWKERLDVAVESISNEKAKRSLFVMGAATKLDNTPVVWPELAPIASVSANPP